MTDHDDPDVSLFDEEDPDVDPDAYLFDDEEPMTLEEARDFDAKAEEIVAAMQKSGARTLGELFDMKRQG